MRESAQDWTEVGKNEASVYGRSEVGAHRRREVDRATLSSLTVSDCEPGRFDYAALTAVRWWRDTDDEVGLGVITDKMESVGLVILCMQIAR